MGFLRIKTLWREQKGFHLTRETVGNEYIFLHLLTPAEFVIDGKKVKAKEGACILYDRHSRQEFSSKDCTLIHDYFHYAGDLSSLSARYGVPFGVLCYPRSGERITSLLQQIERESLKKAPYFEELCDCLLEELFILLARSADPNEALSSVDAQTCERFIRLREEIHNRFDTALSVDEMAAMVNLSPSRFYSVYKSIFGISPKKDHLNIRIEHAKTLLQQKKYSVAQVAAMTGYSNQYHFIRQFREIVGVTPGKYLKQ